MSFLSFFKYVLFIYNFLVMLFGGFLIAAATYFYLDTLNYLSNSERAWPVYSTFFIFIIGLGLLTFIIGFFGCCGACKESSCMLCLYVTIIVAICGLACALILLPERFEIKPQQIRMDLQHDIKDIIQRSYSRYDTSSFPHMVIDRIQEDFQCCGSNNYTDWYNSLQNNSTRPDIGVGNAMASYGLNPASQSSSPRQFGPQSQRQTLYDQQQQLPTVTTTFRVPVSCCSTRHSQNSYLQCKAMISKYDANPTEQQIQRIPNVNQEGCVDKIYQYLFILHWWPMSAICGIAIGIQGLSLIFSLCLCCAVNRAYDDYDDDDEKRI